MAQETGHRTDSMGAVEVPANRHWGAQTERSRHNWRLTQHFVGPPGWCAPIPEASAALSAPSWASCRYRRLHRAAADEARLPGSTTILLLVVFQTGSGTQSNMNANEVSGLQPRHRARGRHHGHQVLVHSQRPSNRGQSSMTRSPTAMHIAVVSEPHDMYPRVRQSV